MQNKMSISFVYPRNTEEIDVGSKNIEKKGKRKTERKDEEIEK